MVAWLQSVTGLFWLLNPVTVKLSEPAFQMMFCPMLTEEPGGSGDQVTTGGAFGSGQDIAALTEPAVEGATGPLDSARSPELLLGSTPGSTHVVDPVQRYWKFPPAKLTVQVSVVSEGLLISSHGESVKNLTATGRLA